MKVPNDRHDVPADVRGSRKLFDVARLRPPRRPGVRHCARGDHMKRLARRLFTLYSAVLLALRVTDQSMRVLTQ